MTTNGLFCQRAPQQLGESIGTNHPNHEWLLSRLQNLGGPIDIDRKVINEGSLDVVSRIGRFCLDGYSARKKSPTSQKQER
jgi:hypothetical protein